MINRARARWAKKPVKQQELTAEQFVQAVRDSWTEEQFIKEVAGLARSQLWKAAHFRPGLTRKGAWVTAVQFDGKGWPDLFLARPADARLLALELKVGRNKCTPEQTTWLWWLKCCGVETHTFWPKDWDAIKGVLK